MAPVVTGLVTHEMTTELTIAGRRGGDTTSSHTWVRRQQAAAGLRACVPRWAPPARLLTPSPLLTCHCADVWRLEIDPADKVCSAATSPFPATARPSSRRTRTRTAHT